jgi:hypothetical protein
MKTNGGSKVIDSPFWTPSLDGNEWSASRPGRFNPGGNVPGGPQSLSECYGEEKNLAPVGNEPRAF